MSNLRGERGERGEQGIQGIVGPNPSEWKTYLLGIFFAILMAMSGTVYGLTSSRITKVENELATRTNIDENTSVQLAVIQENIKELNGTLIKYDQNQTQLVTKVDTLTNNIMRDSRRWNDIMDKFEKDVLGRNK